MERGNPRGSGDGESLDGRFLIFDIFSESDFVISFRGLFFEDGIVYAFFGSFLDISFEISDLFINFFWIIGYAISYFDSYFVFEDESDGYRFTALLSGLRAGREGYRLLTLLSDLRGGSSGNLL